MTKFRVFIRKNRNWHPAPMGDSLAEAIENYKTWDERPKEGAFTLTASERCGRDWAVLSPTDFKTFTAAVKGLPEVARTSFIQFD